jgi:aminoglycoside N3'-acetyltransferase
MLGGPDAVIGYLSRRIIARPAFSRIVITDVRFDNEAAMIRRECGHIAQVVRHDNPHRSTSTHPSNRVIELPDAVIYNNGTKDDLANEVDALLRIHWRKP